MSLASEYWLYEGLETIEIPEVGFATYKIVSPECYIRDVYVRPQYRKSHVCFKIADEIVSIAKKSGCTILIGTVVTSYKLAERSRKVLTTYGFRLGKVIDGTEVYRKDI